MIEVVVIVIVYHYRNWLGLVFIFLDLCIQTHHRPFVVLFVHLVVEHVVEGHAFPDVSQMLVHQGTAGLLVYHILYVLIHQAIEVKELIDQFLVRHDHQNFVEDVVQVVFV